MVNPEIGWAVLKAYWAGEKDGIRKVMKEQVVAGFKKNGFVVIPQVVSPERCDVMHRTGLEELSKPKEPYELESTLGYPGAPDPESPEGLTTIRRLKSAYSRHALWREWAHDPTLLGYVATVLGSQQIALTQAHHNCLMTKAPKWSSRTGWHQDIRYWSFERPELVTAWLSLTDENEDNGCLQVIPGSHAASYEADQFDALKFFQDDLAKNQGVIAGAEHLTMRRGDLLLFDARLLHSAGKNVTEAFKMSLIFTYKLSGNKAIAHSRSAAMPEINMENAFTL